jgi:hypothetical protein
MTILRKTITIIFSLSLMLCCFTGFSQNGWYFKPETGYLRYRATIVDVDPGPGWQGYYLNNEQNGIFLSGTWGYQFRKKIFGGLGAGYLNFEGTSGLAIFTDLVYIPLKSNLSPLLNLNVGYSHLWNQYPGGTGDIIINSGVGLNYKLKENLGLYVQSGMLLTQQTSFIPVQLGIIIY